MKRVVFLDRDGLINRAFVVDGVTTSPRNLGEVVRLPGVREAIHLLFTKKSTVILVINQPDVRGLQPTHRQLTRYILI